MTTPSDKVVVLIPALNEEQAIAHVLQAVPSWVSEVVVVDNGSTDRTAAVAAAHGATVVREPRRGYGAACLAGLSVLDEENIVVFLSGDHSDDPTEMDRVVAPIRNDEADLVIGSRVLGKAEAGSLTLPQRVGNALASRLLNRIWRVQCTDLGPFRAVRRHVLRRLRMSDLGYGWTVEMQARAARMGLRVAEVPVSCRRRLAGRSKVSGTLRGTFGAGTMILGTIVCEALADRSGHPLRRRLILFTRYPTPGMTKTRLIPVLGAEGAAGLQADMTRHALHLARDWADHLRQIEVRYTDGSAEQMAGMFGRDLHYREQGEGDLGERMFRAINQAVSEGCKEVVIIGCDCPGLDAHLIRAAFSRLRTCDAVLGPATDGGYYLIGMRRPIPQLFGDIDWGTADVLRQTKQRAASLGLRMALLPVQSDVDEPADLDRWHNGLHGGTGASRPPAVSVIIPVLNEAAHLKAALDSIGDHGAIEVIVVDGGSDDESVDIAHRSGARVIRSDRGRAVQMNAGAAVARGRLLMFLHADTRLPFNWLHEVHETLSETNTAAGAFRLAFETVTPALGAIEHAANLRSRLLGMPCGDQALFMTRRLFQEIGGYRELPTMEDYDLMQRMRRYGRVRIVPSAVITSARRWLSAGTIRTTLVHQLMILGWHIGIPPRYLAEWRSGSIKDPPARTDCQASYASRASADSVDG